MPVRFVLPLPGPFYWVPKHRTPRTHRSIRHTAAYWLLGLWLFEATFWVTAFVVVGSCWAGWWLLRLTAAGVLWSLGWIYERAFHHYRGRSE